METRPLGNSGLRLSVIGLGAWAIGGPWLYGWGQQDDNRSIEAIQCALDQGINWIDTAHVYGHGHSEEVVSKTLHGRRDRALVATKCSRLPDGKGGVRSCLKAKSIREELEGSLKRLGVEVIDLYQIHWPNPQEDIEEAWEEIQRAIQEGKVRYAGVSNFNIEQMKRLQRIAPIASLQPPYSLLRRDIEKEILPFCKENRIGVVAYSPMLSGLLTGKVTRQWVQDLPDDDWRKRFNEEFQEPRLSINIEFVQSTLRPIAQAHGVDPGQVAIAWTLRDSTVISAIVGGRTAKQVGETVRAAAIRLSRSELDAIETGLKARSLQLK
jgi:aryl-alcohol dehydrogenase-like predicted oxidoreductase